MLCWPTTWYTAYHNNVFLVLVHFYVMLAYHLVHSQYVTAYSYFWYTFPLYFEVCRNPADGVQPASVRAAVEVVRCQSYGSAGGGYAIFTAEFEPLARANLYFTDKKA